MKKIFKKVAFCRRLARSGASVNGHIRIVAPNNLEFGDKIHIGTGSFIDARSGFSIGRGVVFENFVRVISCNHDFRSLPKSNGRRTVVHSRLYISLGEGMLKCFKIRD